MCNGKQMVDSADLASLVREAAQMREQRDAFRTRLAEVERERDKSDELLRRVADSVEAAARLEAERDEARETARTLADPVRLAGTDSGFAFFSDALRSAMDRALAYPRRGGA
jgi:hypothetical protein